MKVPLLVMLLFFALMANAQDSLLTETPDSSNFEFITTVEVSTHSPKRAGIYSAILPGAGQVYNKKTWKVPIVYAALGGAAFFAIDNGKEKKRYQTAIELRNDGDPTTIDEFEGLTASSDLIRIRNTFRERQDLSYIIGGLFYVLNIVDAVVDAHLYDFDVSDDLSLHIQPKYEPHLSPSESFVGVGVTFSFK